MNQTNNPSLKPFAQKLRREMTKEERHLWYDFLKSLPMTVKRQQVMGPYIVDFYIASAKLVIELDGSQHYEKEGIVTDRQRDLFFSDLGIHGLRFSKLDVTQTFNEVCEELLKYV